jgi:hypothetical protein
MTVKKENRNRGLKIKPCLLKLQLKAGLLLMVKSG